MRPAVVKEQLRVSFFELLGVECIWETYFQREMEARCMQFLVKPVRGIRMTGPSLRDRAPVA